MCYTNAPLYCCVPIVHCVTHEEGLPIASDEAAALPFHQLQLRFSDPIQFDYEVIRPVLLFAEPIGVRSEQTGLDRATVRHKARRFLEAGMLGLAAPPAGQGGRPPHVYPPPVARHLLWVKQLYPPITAG